MAGKLHEILAVEKGLESVAKKLSEETISTLRKDNLFLGSVKAYKVFDDDKRHLNTTDVVDLTTTVNENLDYVNEHIAAWWDVVLEKDSANQKATADIVLKDGTVLATDVPATFLLGMETKLNTLRKMYEPIPTLAPGVNWIIDESNAKDGVYISPEKIKQFKTEKDVEFRVVSEATPHHPAQIREVAKVLTIGEYETTRWSGMVTPFDKARKLSRLDDLLIAIRKARQRANDQVVDKKQIGKDLLDYINS